MHFNEVKVDDLDYFSVNKNKFTSANNVYLATLCPTAHPILWV